MRALHEISSASSKIFISSNRKVQKKNIVCKFIKKLIIKVDRIKQKSKIVSISHIKFFFKSAKNARLTLSS